MKKENRSDQGRSDQMIIKRGQTPTQKMMTTRMTNDDMGDNDSSR